MKYGVWDGKAWLRNFTGAIMHWDDVGDAETICLKQRTDWPELPWTVHVIGPDEKPYIPEAT